MSLSLSEQPYLSVVVTTRNDNHGGDLNNRTQIFINGLSTQVNKFKLPTELIIVEWNPPDNRPPLVEAFCWPKKNPYLTVRIITVPKEIHNKFKFAEKLPLYQMIGKNVGVRRAKGSFVLQTNIDLLFSDDLIATIAARNLKKATLYRCDRVDVDRYMPANGTFEEQIKYCENNVLRIAKKQGMWIRDEKAKTSTVKDVVHVPYSSFNYEALDSKSMLFFILYSPAKILIFFEGLIGRFLSIFKSPFIYIIGLVVVPIKAILRGLRAGYAEFMDHFWYSHSANVLRRVLYAHAYLRQKGFALPSKEMIKQIYLTEKSRGISLPDLHTNACGDFMLMDKISWDVIQGSPEIIAYSMHIDSLTMMVAYANGFKIEDLKDTMVTYHIEHGGGWTPEGNYKMYKNFINKKIRILTYNEYRYLSNKILNKSIQLCDSNWGLGSDNLAEVELKKNRKEQDAYAKIEPQHQVY